MSCLCPALLRVAHSCSHEKSLCPSRAGPALLNEQPWPSLRPPPLLLLAETVPGPEEVTWACSQLWAPARWLPLPFGRPRPNRRCLSLRQKDQRLLHLPGHLRGFRETEEMPTLSLASNSSFWHMVGSLKKFRKHTVAFWSG